MGVGFRLVTLGDVTNQRGSILRTPFVQGAGSANISARQPAGGRVRPQHRSSPLGSFARDDGVAQDKGRSCSLARSVMEMITARPIEALEVSND